MPRTESTTTVDAKSRVNGIRCLRCSHVNGENRKFCAECGKALWTECPKCGSSRAVDETYCGGCGADLQSDAKAKIADFESRLQSVRRLGDEFRFDDALLELVSLARAKHVLLEDRLPEVKQLRAQFEEQRDQWNQRIEKTRDRAVRLLMSHSYESACGVLEEIPETLRDRKFTALLDEATNMRKDVLRLSGEIREAVETKKTLDLMPKLERLITLQPNHEQARRLAVQLRDQLCQRAGKKLAESKYQEAVDALRRIAPFVATKESNQLLARAEELLWLHGDLKTAPFVDSTLLAVAGRLAELDPANQAVAALKQRITERQAIRLKDVHIPAPPWAAFSAETARFDFPIEWLGGSSRIQNWNSIMPGDRRPGPGCLFVACGLALQGIDRAAIRMNLSPEIKKRSFAKISLRRRSVEPLSAWGIDLGETSLKAVKLGVDDDRVVMQQWEQIEYARPLTQADGDFDRNRLLAGAIEQLVSGREFEGPRICVSICGGDTIGRYFELPPVEEKQVGNVIEYEIGNQIPLPLGELSWDYHLFEASTRTSGEPQRHAAVVATRQQNVDDRKKLFSDLKLNVDVVQAEPVALHNFFMFEFASETPDDDDAGPPAADDLFAVLDVGGKSSNLIVGSRDAIVFRNCTFGGQSFTRALLQPFNLTFEQAEQLKHQPTKARRVSKVFQTFQPVFDSAASEIERSLIAMRKQVLNGQISRMFCVGGGMQLHGALHRLRSAEQPEFFSDLKME